MEAGNIKLAFYHEKSVKLYKNQQLITEFTEDEVFLLANCLVSSLELINNSQTTETLEKGGDNA